MIFIEKKRGGTIFPSDLSSCSMDVCTTSAVKWLSNGDDNDSDNDVDEKKDDDNVDVADVVINIVMKLGMKTMRMMMMTLVIATGDNGKHWCFH